MARKVIILDTSILCVWLRIPNMDSIEKSGEKPITYDDVSKSIEKETADSSRIVLPLASIIECGNHITQINRKDSQKYVNECAGFIEKALDGSEPWDIFTNQSELLSTEGLRNLVNEWKSLSCCGLSMGDVSIKQVAYYYYSKGYTAEIFTGDTGLKAYQPAPHPQILSRNRNRR